MREEASGPMGASTLASASEIRRAARRGDTAALQVAIAELPCDAEVRLATVNAPGRAERTALHWSASRGDVEAVSVLLDAGAEVLVLDRYALTPLTLAAYKGRVAAAECLVAHGAREPGAVMAAVRGRQPLVLELLLDAGLDADVDLCCYTALSLACAQGDRDIAALLLGHGAGIDRRGICSRRPLLCAIEHGHVDVVRELLRRGADTADALEEALDGRSLAMLQALLDHGVTAAAALAAIRRRSYAKAAGELLRLLLARGLSAPERDEAFRVAMDMNDAAAVTHLLAAGVSEPETAIRLAAVSQDPGLIGWYEQAEAQHRHRMAARALSHAARTGDALTAAFVLDRGWCGADDCPAGEPAPALLLAAWSEHMEVARVLVSHGADANCLWRSWSSDPRRRSFSASRTAAALGLRRPACDATPSGACRATEADQRAEAQGALLLAASTGDPDRIRRLVGSGSNVNEAAPGSRTTALHLDLPPIYGPPAM